MRDDYRCITTTKTNQPLPGKKGVGEGAKERTREVQAWALATQKPSPEEFESTSLS